MKTMNYLLPAGNEVFLSNQFIAEYFFQDDGKEGKVSLNIISESKDCSNGILCWTCLASDKNVYFINVFRDDSERIPSKPKSYYFCNLEEGTSLFFAGKLYKVEKTINGLEIMYSPIIANDLDANFIAEQMGYKNMYFIPCKIFIQEKTREFLTVLWIGYDEGENIVFPVPFFEEDINLVRQYGYHDLIKEPLGNNDKFTHDGVLWIVEQKDDNYNLHKLMSIIK